VFLTNFCMNVFCNANLQPLQETILDAVIIDLQEIIHTKITQKHPGGAYASG
jgi:hypothetical protein